MDVEKFIRENRADFDCQTPSADLWSKIEDKLPEPKQAKFYHRSFLSVFRMAASVVLLIGIGYLIGQYWRPITQQSDIARLSPKYAKEVTEYTSFISAKREELQKLTTENPELFKEFKTELENLETEYQSLKNSLPKNPNQEELLTAMIQNLQWQLEILNQQVEIIRKINENTNEKAAEMV